MILTVAEERCAEKVRECQEEIDRLRKEVDEREKELEAQGISMEEYFAARPMGVFQAESGERCCCADTPYTNFDHIKEMDEYQLAWEMQKLMHCNGCKLFRDGENKCFIDDFTCRDRIVEWLREEYK